MSDLEAEDSRRPLSGQWLLRDRPPPAGSPLADAGPDRGPAAVCVRRAPAVTRARYAAVFSRTPSHTAAHCRTPDAHKVLDVWRMRAAGVEVRPITALLGGWVGP